VKIEQKPHFQRTCKKLNANQLGDVDNAIKHIADNPEIGKTKIGNLSGLRVHKFKMNKQPVLLAYIHQPASVVLLALGSRENFYRDLKHLGG